MTTTNNNTHGGAPANTQELLAQIAALRAENAKLQANKASKGSSIKISPKGGISVYGLGRFPVTLYASQWQSLADKMPEIQEFIIANAQSLASKDVKQA